MQVVLYSQIALQQQEKQLFNVKLGVALAYLMEYLVYQNPNVHRIKLK